MLNHECRIMNVEVGRNSCIADFKIQHSIFDIRHSQFPRSPLPTKATHVPPDPCKFGRFAPNRQGASTYCRRALVVQPNL